MRKKCISEEKYRLNVAALIRFEGKYLACERADALNAWQTVQGGIEIQDKSYEAAIQREICEELGLTPSAFKIVFRSPVWRRYKFFKKNSENIGQEQLWFEVELLDLHSIDLVHSHGEFKSVKLVDIETLVNNYVLWKRPVIRDFCYERGLLKF